MAGSGIAVRGLGPTRPALAALVRASLVLAALAAPPAAAQAPPSTAASPQAAPAMSKPAAPKPPPQATKPQPASAPAAPRGPLTQTVRFDTAPFPYRGRVDGGAAPFFDLVEPATKRRGRATASGAVYWEDQTYSDSRVLLHIPAGFDPRKPVVLVVFLHGQMATLERTVVGEMQIPRQIGESGLNAVLVAPQLAYDAADSSPGKFWQDAAFARFLDEAAERLKRLWGDPRAGGAFNAAGVVLVAFSGGYKPAAWALARGGANHRIRGVVLLDALYGEEDKFAAWFARHRGAAFLASLHTDSTRINQDTLRALLRRQGIAPVDGLPATLGSGMARFFDAGPRERHPTYPIDGPPRDAVKTVLAAAAAWKPEPPPRPAPAPKGAAPPKPATAAPKAAPAPAKAPAGQAAPAKR